MQKLIPFLLSILIVQLNAQDYNPLSPPNTYQHPDNPYYWKNKAPSLDYWQQDVYYKMNIVVDEKTDILSGTQNLTYWNNSKDTLHYVYFHLYANQAVKNSYLSKLNQANGRVVKYGKYQKEELGIEILSMQTNGISLKTEEDNTILKVYLESPLYPNGKTSFDIVFKSYYDNGSIRRRMKAYNSWGKKHYNGAHWYPRIAAYDRKFGWTTDQHLGREFYGDFGTYDVTLTFANDYIVGATGHLLNRDEMYPKELWEKLKIENFKDKPWNEKPSEIIKKEEGKRKSWHFYSENTPDFAFVADPNFRIGESEWNGIKTYSFVEEPHASKWQNAAEYTAEIIKVFSKDIGMYGWHKMLVTDARSGMEYPMLTMDAGKDPSYRGLLVHEVGHNWFFGMINNNETYRAFMDEGFTQFLTAWGLEAIDGKEFYRNEPKGWYRKKFSKPVNVRESRVYYGYLRDATLKKDPQLNTHSDGFHGAIGHGGGYGHVYYKAAAMLYNLQYVLGDELFLKSMKHYFDKWSYCHPYPADFRKAIIEYSKTDLNWFFDQWLETDKTLDYKISSIYKSDDNDSTYHVAFQRKGRMQMPIDFQVIDKDDRTYDFHIPNNYFVKKTDATVLPKWTGWDKLNEEYIAKITLPNSMKDGKQFKIKNVVIDPSERLADANMYDNRLSGNVEWKFDSHVWNFPNTKKYQVFWRPDVWWNAYDGIKVGGHLRGSFLGKKHLFSLLAGFNTRLLQADLPFDKANHYTNGRLYYRFNYRTPLDAVIPHSQLNLQSRYLDGLLLNKVEFSKEFKNEITLSVGLKSMIRPDEEGNKYLLYPKEWETQKWNNTVNVALEHDFKFYKNKVRANIKGMARSNVFSDYKDFWLSLEYKANERIGPLDMKTRAYALFASSQNKPSESALYLAGGNPEEMMENKYVRSSGFYPIDWVGDYGLETNHFHYGGGLNLRGYSGYRLLVSDTNALSSNQTYKGNSGAAFNFEVAFDRMIKFKKIPKFFKNFDVDMYVFGDIGLLSYTDTYGTEKILSPRMDAGLGTTLTIKRFGPLSGIKPLVIRFDMPFFVSHAPSTENSFKFRWVLGINRAF